MDGVGVAARVRNCPDDPAGVPTHRPVVVDRRAGRDRGYGCQRLFGPRHRAQVRPVRAHELIGKFE